MDKAHYLQKTSMVCLLALLCCFLWGSAFPCIKIGYALFAIDSTDTWSQILFAGIRFTLAGMLVVLVASVPQKKILLPKKGSWGMVAKISMAQTVIQYFFFYVGLAHTTGVKGSIIEGAHVFLSILIAALLFRQEKMTKAKTIGCIIGFSGVILVNVSGSEGLGGGIALNGEGFLLIACVSYAFSSVLVKIYSAKESPVVLSGYQFIMGGAIMTAAAWIGGGHLTVTSAWAYPMMLYMALISAVAYSVWGVLLKYNPVSKVTIFGFTTPVFGVVLSALLLDESGQIPWVQSLIALLFVCAGIFIVDGSGAAEEMEASDEETAAGQRGGAGN